MHVEYNTLRDVELLCTRSRKCDIEPRNLTSGKSNSFFSLNSFLLILISCTEFLL